MPIEITRYKSSMKDTWDTFVKSSKNGTFLFMRDYMDYHSDRFEDISLMIYENGELYALLPANINRERRQIISHGGLTYGGLLINDTVGTEKVLQIFDSFLRYYKENSEADKFIYKPVPHIYHRYPCEEELYALFRHNAKLTERKISSTIRLCNALPFKGRRKHTSAMKSRLNIIEDNNFNAFWEILSDRLKYKYQTSPVHTLEEIELLHSRFPENIRLYRITDNNATTLGGIVLYLMGNVAHAQYAATTDEGRRIGVLDYLYGELIRERLSQFEYLDFGTSTENNGTFLNTGLISQKEGFGGRGIVYDTYELTI